MSIKPPVPQPRKKVRKTEPKRRQVRRNRKHGK
jgi:hypothetical protein